MFCLLLECRVYGRDRITMHAVQYCGASDEMSRERKHALQCMCKVAGHDLQHLQAKPASYKLLAIRANSICNYTLPRMLGGLLAVSQAMHYSSYVCHRYECMLEMLSGAKNLFMLRKTIFNRVLRQRTYFGVRCEGNPVLGVQELPRRRSHT